MEEDTVLEHPTYVLVKARAMRELTEAVHAANLDVAKLHHRLTADGCFVPDHPLYEPLALHGPLSWTDDLAKAFTPPHSDRAAEGFSNPRAASSRKVRSAVMALQFALGVVEDGIVGPATMQAIDGIRAGGEADRVMVRAVSPAYPGPDVDRDTWAFDPDATGHRAPFAAGDLVVRSSGREGTHRVVDVTVDGDAPRYRSLCITVEPMDVVVDQDAF